MRQVRHPAVRSQSSIAAFDAPRALRRLACLSAAAPLMMLAGLAHAQGTAPAAPSAADAQAFNPSADISRAVSKDSTDTAIQNNWNSITHPAPVAKPAEEKPAPRRRNRGVNIGTSTN